MAITALFSICLTVLLALVLGFLSVPLFIKLALKLNIMDSPDGVLKKHKQPTPYLGGLAVYVSVIGSYLVYYLHSILYNNIINISYINGSFLISLSLFTLLGLIDDIYRLDPLKKFAGQFLITFYALSAYNLLNFSSISNSLYSLLCLLWGVALVNAFNLVDIMDGLASTLGLASAGSLLIYTVLSLKSISVCVLLIAFIVSLLVFLLYNKNPAQVYLGDCGSHFIGGFFALLSFVLISNYYCLHNNYSNASNLFYISCFFFIPLVDLLALTIIRASKNIPFYKGSPHHYALYLKHKKWSITQILLYSCVVSFSVSVSLLLYLFSYISWTGNILSMSIIYLAWCSVIYTDIYIKIRKYMLHFISF